MYTSLPNFSAPLDPPVDTQPPSQHTSQFRLQAETRRNKSLKRRLSHLYQNTTAQTSFKQAIEEFKSQLPTVRFRKDPRVATFLATNDATMMTYDSGADGHYFSETDRQKAGLPIIRRSTKRVGVANGGTSTGKYVTKLPFQHLSDQAAEADTFDDFPSSLLSVGKTSDDGNISIFTKKGVTVHKEEDVLITCKGAPILIGKRDERGRYRIPLVQERGQWAPRHPTKTTRDTLQQANSVYDLPSTEQAIRWMHAVCGFPVKSTWLKAVKAGNYIGWPMLTTKNVTKYYPETIETPKGHLNQTRKNVRSTKPALLPLEISDATSLRGKKQRDVFTKVYDVRETIFSDQTGQFLKKSQRGNKYLMVMVEIDSNAILVEPLKSRKDAELTRAYHVLMMRLKTAGIVPRKHVLDNEVSSAMTDVIRDKYKMEMELVPPGCHRRNAAEVAIRNFKAHFLSVLAGVADDFPLTLWDRLLPQTEITLNLLRQSNATPTVSAHAHFTGPFDYNKMPLAPMGCAAQIHEKTDNRGTWHYHSVDGWYLFTSEHHYRVHNCHVKNTRSERLTDTVHLQHKTITNPQVSHADKVMAAISDCSKAIKGMTATENDPNMRQLQQLVRLTTQAARNNPDLFTTNVEDNHLPVPRVFATNSDDENRRITRSMTPTTQPLPRVSVPITPVPPRKRAKRRAVVQAPVAITAPAQNTRSRTAAATRLAAAISTGTRARTKARAKSTRPQTPTNKKSTTTRWGGSMALAVQRKRRLQRRGRIVQTFAQRIQVVENEVHQAMAVLDKTTGKMLNYRQLMRHPILKKDWQLSSANEFGRLANGVGGRIKGTNTIKFIRMQDVKKGRMKDVTYGQFLCLVRPEKAEPNRTRFVVGGDRINYPGEVGTPTAEMLVAKILFNSVISTKNARFMTMDIANFYLMTPLARPEYIRVSIRDIPDEIIQEYNLQSIVTDDGMIYIEANRGMYGLPQAGLLANELLEKRLNKRGYYQSKLVPGLWKHEWRPIQFTLVVDDFGVKYVGKEHALHLKSTLEDNYGVTTEWDGKRYIGITLDWDYERRQVHLSMPGYISKALKVFQHEIRTKQDQPFPSAPIQYGAKTQYAKERSTAPLLDAKGKKFIQQVCGKFLFLGRAVDATLLCPISAIASQSATPTEDTLEHTRQFLDYVATQEEAVLTYNASDMKLAAHSDASYLSEPKARSRAGGHFFLSSDATVPHNNGAVLNIAHIIKHVMTSATEAELAALYITAREAVYLRIILEEMGHKQPPTPLQTDNAMAEAVSNGKIQPKRTKAMDMRFHWLRDRECQRQFRIYWRPGKLNYADYWTKHHAALHHKNVRKEFLTPHIVLEMLRVEQSRLAAAAA